MPCVQLQNLEENLFFYWMKLTTVVRDMITFAPNERIPLVLDGQRLSKVHETACKYFYILESDYKDTKLTLLVCEDHVFEFKNCFRLAFSLIPDCRWNDYCARCILLLWEIIQITTYHQPCSSNIPLLKLTDFRISGKFILLLLNKYLTLFFRFNFNLLPLPLHATLTPRYRLSSQAPIQTSPAQSFRSTR